MLDPNRLCLGCMNELEEENKICKICGWNNETDENKPHQLQPGTILQGKYLVGKVLGEGGFGITYLGWNILLQEKVAIKEFYPHGFVGRDTTVGTTVMSYVGQEEFTEKQRDAFVKESRTMSDLRKIEGIVEMKDIFTENQTVYIVMEYIEGKNLKEYVNENGTLSMDKAIELLSPVMNALEKVHASGLIHRDISPDNIMISPDGRVTLLDFGAARQISADGGHSLTINLKHGYAPFEQYQTHGEQGPWTDIYALCATIYRIITGKLPQSSTDRLLEDNLERPSLMGVDITPEQEEVLFKGLAVRISERHLNIFELRDDFEKASEKQVEKPKEEEKKPEKKKKEKTKAKEKPVPAVSEKVKEKVPEEKVPEEKPAAKKGKSKVKKVFITIAAVLASLIIILAATVGIVYNVAMTKFSEMELSEEYEGFNEIMTDFIGKDYVSIIFNVIRGEKNLFKTVEKIYYINQNYNNEDYKTYLYVEDFADYNVKIAKEIKEELYGYYKGTGSYGENAFWKLTNANVLTIIGEGSILGPSSEQKWLELVNGQKELRIYVEEGITEIGDYVFSGIIVDNIAVYLPRSLDILSPIAFVGSNEIQIDERFIEKFEIESPVQGSAVSVREAKIGDIITFGSYEQDNNLKNGAEPIEWQVLDIQDGKALVISKYGLDCKPYNDSKTNVTWKTCSLRKWLNEDFVDNAFGNAEKNTILTAKVSNTDNPKYGTKGGKDTEDKVFILSIDETKEYFSSNEERKCEPSAYTKEQGVRDGSSGNCWWWLRSPGYYKHSAAIVNYDGDVREIGGNVHDGIFAVRPAMWIDLSAFEQEPEVTVFPENISKGNVISFGSYEQDNNLGNGAEPIEWQVLDVKDEKIMLVSKFVLDATRCEGGSKGYGLAILPWLNNTFYSSAFTENEKKGIVVVETDYNYNNFGISGQGTIAEKVRVMTYQEFTKSYKTAAKTEYVKNNYSFAGYDTVPYYLIGSVARGNNIGLAKKMGDYIGIRPVIWVDTSVFE
ncbi:MAG: serine/threonine protein kinase [Oscillospiraceae bacterium]|nr:serine/threonine protein kinase [Oscillospiraceae bacterium]